MDLIYKLVHNPAVEQLRIEVFDTRTDSGTGETIYYYRVLVHYVSREPVAYETDMHRTVEACLVEMEKMLKEVHELDILEAQANP